VADGHCLAASDSAAAAAASVLESTPAASCYGVTAAALGLSRMIAALEISSSS